MSRHISCSGRKLPEFYIKTYLDTQIQHAAKHSNFEFGYEDIDSVFGQVEEYCPLYGGRPAEYPEMFDNDIKWIYDNGIGMKLTLQNKFITDKHYKDSKPLLKEYNRPGNSVITATDKLSEYIKNDFPHYKIEASCIQDITDNDHYEKTVALGLYDTIVLPIHCNDDLEFVKSIKRKDMLRLFMNVECSYSCPSKVCYATTSKINSKDTERPFVCSLIDFGQERTFYNDDINWGEFYFDLPMYEKMGISKFKLVPPIEVQQRTALMYKKNHDWLVKKK
tara:strand:- start:972 stop:1805 length:834 start_codon:yes stop_codon:yes gene_type:complete